MKKFITAIAMLLFAGMAAMAQETSYNKTDFVPGDEIIFDDNFEGERIGEFPMSWDLLDGYAETAQQQGRNVIAFTDNGLGQVRGSVEYGERRGDNARNEHLFR